MSFPEAAILLDTNVQWRVTAGYSRCRRRVNISKRGSGYIQEHNTRIPPDSVVLETHIF